MPMYHLIVYSDIYLKTSGSLWQYYRDEPDLDNNGHTVDFPADNNNNSISLKFLKITPQKGNCSTKDVKMILPLKYLSNFWRTLEMTLINCEINLILPCSANVFFVADTVANQVPTFTITDTKLYVVVTLSTQGNAKLLEQLKTGFKRITEININLK